MTTHTFSFASRSQQEEEEGKGGRAKKKRKGGELAELWQKKREKKKRRKPEEKENLLGWNREKKGKKEFSKTIKNKKKGGKKDKGSKEKKKGDGRHLLALAHRLPCKDAGRGEKNKKKKRGIAGAGGRSDPSGPMQQTGGKEKGNLFLSFKKGGVKKKETKPVVSPRRPENRGKKKKGQLQFLDGRGERKRESGREKKRRRGGKGRTCTSPSSTTSILPRAGEGNKKRGGEARRRGEKSIPNQTSFK